MRKSTPTWKSPLSIYFFNVYNSFPARPAVCGDGERPQIRAVIIIQCPRGIVNSSPQNVKEPCFRTVLLLNFGLRF